MIYLALVMFGCAATSAAARAWFLTSPERSTRWLARPSLVAAWVFVALGVALLAVGLGR